MASAPAWGTSVGQGAVTVKATPALAAQQGPWIAALEPWRSLGYGGEALGRFLMRTAREGVVLVATSSGRGPLAQEAALRPAGGRREVLGVVALRWNVLLGGFVALLAVQRHAAGQGLGRALMAAAETETARRHRWLYVSADLQNQAALRFYRRGGFERVGKLPDLIRAGRTEILLRKAVTSGAPAKPLSTRLETGAGGSRQARTSAQRRAPPRRAAPRQSSRSQSSPPLSSSSSS